MRSKNICRPFSLRRTGAALAFGVSAAVAASVSFAQTPPETDREVELETLSIKDFTADSNPYAQDGASYKAQFSGDVRRVQPLAETPATIQVLTEAQIKESGETDLRDILDGVPGVTVGTGENGNAFGDRYIIRGHEIRSDVFVDGLRDPGMTTRESFAVDQIEVTKGPSATFGGRGTTGGAVNSITKQASTDYNFFKGEVGAGTHDFQRVTVDANLRLSDAVAVRTNLLYAHEEVPDRAPAERDRLGGAISASFQFTDKLRAVIDYYHLTAEDLPDLGGYAPAPTGSGPGDVVIYDPWDEVPVYAQNGDFLDSKVDAYTGRVFFEPSANFKITNSLRFGSTENAYVLTGLRGGGPINQNLTLSSHQGWQDVEYFVDQLNATTSFATGSWKHTLIAGLEYSDLEVLNGVFRLTNTGAPNCRTTGTGANNNFCLTNASGAVIPGDLQSRLGRVIDRGPSDSDWNVKTTSTYVMDSIDVTSWLTLHGGVRADAIDYSNVIWNTTTLAETVHEFEDTLWNGHLGVVLKPHEEGIFYLSWGSAKDINGGESDLGANCGYGGVCVVNGVSDVGDGSPESSTNFEIGTKWDLFNDRFLVTAAAFELTKDDVFEQGSADSYSTFGSLNTGKNRVVGIELGVVGNLTEKLSGQVAFTAMDSEILETNQTPPAGSPAGATLVGKRLSNFADNHFSGQLRYQATGKFSFGGAATYKSETYTGQPDSPADFDFVRGVYRFRVPDYWVFDVFANYEFSRNVGARLNVNNLTDEDYYLAGYRSGHFFYKGDAQRIILTLTGKF